MRKFKQPFNKIINRPIIKKMKMFGVKQPSLKWVGWSFFFTRNVWVKQRLKITKAKKSESQQFSWVGHTTPNKHFFFLLWSYSQNTKGYTTHISPLITQWIHIRLPIIETFHIKNNANTFLQPRIPWMWWLYMNNKPRVVISLKMVRDKNHSFLYNSKLLSIMSKFHQ